MRVAAALSLAIFIAAAAGQLQSPTEPPVETPLGPEATPTGDRNGVPEARPPSSNTTELRLQGHVVWLAKALREQFGVNVVPEAAEYQLALQTDDGRLFPLIEDVRGRAFRRDERLREMKLELLVRQFPGAGALQVVQVVAIKPDGKYRVDYWCDICAIAMYELGECDCCQAPNHLRLRPLDRAR